MRLIAELESFLLELGSDFAFVGRQRRLRIASQWFRVDLVFFHRRLRCLVIIDLKLGHFTHADAGQMHLYLNYAREHWTVPGERPVGKLERALCLPYGDGDDRPEGFTVLPSGELLVVYDQPAETRLAGDHGVLADLFAFESAES